MLRIAAAAVLAAVTVSPQTALALGSLADIAIYDRARGETLPVYAHEGRYYVAGHPGNEYEIRLRNQAGRDVLAVISVDGVNVITGETANWRQSGYVLGAWSDATIQGFRKSLDRTAAFYFTRQRDSYAARTGRPHNVGVIGVALFESRQLPPPLPMEYDGYGSADGAADKAAEASRSQAPNAAGAPVRRQKRLGTGHGRSEYSPVRYADFERASERPTEVVAIHYDSYRNLVARGVIPQPAPWPHPEPDPFPGQFVPDPDS